MAGVRRRDAAGDGLRCTDATRGNVMDWGYPDLEENKIESLAAIMCTEMQIAEFFNVPLEYIRGRYMHAVQAGWEKGKIKIRQMQFDMAKDGNEEMLKWLGKQYLGQS